MKNKNFVWKKISWNHTLYFQHENLKLALISIVEHKHYEFSTYFTIPAINDECYTSLKEAKKMAEDYIKTNITLIYNAYN